MPEVDFSCACQVCAPLEEGAVAPAPPLPVFPYVIVKVEPPASVREETVIVWPATETVPALAVVYPPLEPVVDGAFQPAGTTSVTEPLEMPPVAAVYVKVSVFAGRGERDRRRRCRERAGAVGGVDGDAR